MLCMELWELISNEYVLEDCIVREHACKLDMHWKKMYEPWPQPYAFGCLHAIKLCRRNIQQVMSRLLIEKAKGNRTVWVQKIVRILCDSQSPPWHLNQSTNSGLARGGLIKGRAGSAVRTQFSKTFYWTFSNLNFEIFLVSFTIYFSLFFVSFPLNQP